MKKQISLIIALVIEIFLITVILVIFIVGLAGLFMPILPGLIVIAGGLAIYFTLLKNKNNKVIPLVHQRLVKTKKYFHIFKNNKISMGLIKKIKKRKQEKLKAEILKYGLILFGFNLALTLALFFALTGLILLTLLLNFQGVILAFVPLLVIFLFAAACAIVWYRYGQILSHRFKKNKVLSTGLVVIISVIPLLLVLFFLTLIVNALSTVSGLLVVIFIGTVFVTVLAVVFEVLIVSLGVITNKN